MRRSFISYTSNIRCDCVMILFRTVDPTPEGSAAAYFPETNVLVPLDHTADGPDQTADRCDIK